MDATLVGVAHGDSLLASSSNEVGGIGDRLPYSTLHIVALAFLGPSPEIFMTLIIDRERGAGTIHVLIIGVGLYEKGCLETLGGVGTAVTRKFEWWRDKAKSHWLDGRTLGSIEVLNSSKETVSLIDDLGAPTTPSAPTLQAVKNALKDWIGRVATGGAGALVWIGHGGMLCVEGRGAEQVLYCCDEHNGEPHGINEGSLVHGICLQGGSAQIMCFLDACRSKLDEDRCQFPPAFDYLPAVGLPYPQPPYVLRSTYDGADSFCHDVAVPDADFPGGPIFTNALVDIFDRFHCVERELDQPRVFIPATMTSTLADRVRRMYAHIPERDEEVDPEHSCDFSPSWANNAMFTMPDAESMVDVVPPPEDTVSTVACSVTSAAGQALRTVSAKCCFHSTARYSSHTCELFDAKHRKRQRKAIFQKAFTPKNPYTKISAQRGSP